MNPMTQPERDAYAQMSFALLDGKVRMSVLIRRLVLEMDAHQRHGEKIPRWKQIELQRACLELRELNREVRP